ncbi:MAG: hypothetical protein AB7F31_05420 [Parachlamydiales bacterium]
MFNRALTLGLTFVALLTALLAFALFRITDSDREEYHALLTPGRENIPLLSQERREVTKEIHTGEHHLTLRCHSSTLALSKGETAEEMEGIVGDFESGHFEAERGEYDYRTHHLTAQKGTLHGEALQGEAARLDLYFKSWPADLPPLFLHTAGPDGQLIVLQEEAHLHHKGHTLDGEAVWIAQKGGELDGALALGPTTLSSPSGALLHTEGSLLLDTATQTLIATGDPVHYADPRGSFTTDRLALSYDPEGPRATRLHLQGNVEIAATSDTLPLRKALADEALYLPATDKLTLKAAEGKRVLFLDDSSDLRLSAHEVVAHTREHKVEGVGGVRCYLQEEELRLLTGSKP